MIEYKYNISSFNEVETHLARVDKMFSPELSSYVDIHSYAVKIAELADREEAWDGNNLIGLIAYYINQEGKFAFITNVSVEEKYQKQGVASQLLSNTIKDIASKNITTIRLEVHQSNRKAINFYTKNHFQLMDENDECRSSVFLKLEL